jgi:capsular polysaccharide biosynthesis protein
LKPTAVIDRFVLDPGQRSTEQIEGTAVLLSSEEPSNYGSWIFRVLPKLHTLATLNLCQPLRYLAWAGLPTFREYLRILGIADEQIIQHEPQHVIYNVDQLIVPSLRNNQAFLDPESVSLFARLRDQLGAPRKPGARIYVSRLLQSRTNSSRVMQNEPELVERLAALGFRIVTPEALSVAEQVLAFSTAEMVVGPSGSGMFNVVFCRPGTRIIDIESEPHWIHAHRSLFASCGLQFGIFVGKTVDHDFREHHRPWTVNIQALLARIKSFSCS